MKVWRWRFLRKTCRSVERYLGWMGINFSSLNCLDDDNMVSEESIDVRDSQMDRVVEGIQRYLRMQLVGTIDLVKRNSLNVDNVDHQSNALEGKVGIAFEDIDRDIVVVFEMCRIQCWKRFDQVLDTMRRKITIFRPDVPDPGATQLLKEYMRYCADGSKCQDDFSYQNPVFDVSNCIDILQMKVGGVVTNWFLRCCLSFCWACILWGDPESIRHAVTSETCVTTKDPIDGILLYEFTSKHMKEPLQPNSDSESRTLCEN